MPLRASPSSGRRTRRRERLVWVVTCRPGNSLECVAPAADWMGAPSPPRRIGPTPKNAVGGVDAPQTPGAVMVVRRSRPPRRATTLCAIIGQWICDFSPGT